MALVVEDGTAITNANTYASVNTVRAYATARGVTLDGSNDVVAAQIINATDYLESFGSRYKGARVGTTQALSWPRLYAYLYDNIADRSCEMFPSDAIPQALIDAQCQCVIEQANGIALLPSTSGPFVKRETVGPITTEYSEQLGTTQQPTMPAVARLLRNLVDYMGPLSNFRG